MKYRPADYAEALNATLSGLKAGEEASVFKNFIQLVEKNGDRSSLPKILTEMESLIAKKEGGRVVTLEFAREPQNAILAKMKKEFGAKDIVNVRTNATLVAGVRITIDGEQELDLSLNRRLRGMFKN